MSDTDSLDYLHSGFDPASLTVPRLRSILVAYNISYPSTAKKSQLVDILTKEILPLRSKILKEREYARRSSRGIVDADPQEGTITVEESTPPLPTPRRSSRKASAKVKVEESEEDMPVFRELTRSPTKRTIGANTKHPRTSDTDPGTDHDIRRKSARRTRRSEVSTNHDSGLQGILKDVGDNDAGVQRVKKESAFTDDNPFQSGSSPISGVTTTEKRRKSLGASANKETRNISSSATRRRTEIVQVDAGIPPPSRATIEAPISTNYSLKDVDENGVEVSEEFTPEEQLELAREQATTGNKSIGPLRPSRKPAGGFSLKGPLWVLVLTALGGYSAWYRQEKVAVGYCGVGREVTPVLPATWKVPDWARSLVEPDCEPCPQHAYCSENMKTQCEHDFILKNHPLSLGGVIPLAPTCEPDGIKVRKVKAVADRAVEELRERRAKFECSDLKYKAGVTASTVEIETEELKKAVSQKRRKGMSEAEFEDLWAGGLAEMMGREEVVVSVAEGTQVQLSSTSLARLPITCALRRSLRNTVAAHRLQIGSLILIILALIYARAAYRSRQKTIAAIPYLVSLTLERLTHQASAHQEDQEVERWISIGQLRDDVLRDEHSVQKREKLWQRVRAVVEMNANVRSSQKEDRNGEVSRVWEWIGVIEGANGTVRRRKSDKVSRGKPDGDARPSGSHTGPDLVQARWTEGRPVY